MSAKTIAKMVISPMSTFNLNVELVSTPKPTANMKVLMTILRRYYLIKLFLDY